MSSDGWTVEALRGLVEVRDSLREPVNADARAKRAGRYPYYGANGQAGTIDDYRYEGEHILVAEDGGFFEEPWRGVAYRVSGQFWVNNHAHVLRAGPRILARFLELQLNTLDWLKYVSGTTRLKLTQASLNGVQLRVPPLDVQRRIVAKLDALLSQTRAAREQLEAVPALVEQYRQSVLAAAFRGDLTADWRKQHPDVEPASKLLKRIRLERRAKWEAAELAKLKAKGKAPKDDKWKSKYVEPEPIDTSDLPELPPTWCWASVEELCPWDGPAVYGIIQPGPDVPRGVPYIRPLDIGPEGTVVLDELKRTSTKIADSYERSMLAPGDVVLSIVGTIGKVLVVSPELRGANITQSSIRIRPVKGMTTDFLALGLQSPLLRRQYDRYRFGNAVQRLNVEHVRRLAFPVAPPTEAEVLARLVMQRLGATKRIDEQLSAGDISGLERALLAKAFRGELVD